MAPAGEPSVSAPDLPGLFKAAALYLAARLADPATVVPGGLRDRLRVEAPDLTTLMARWLREILFQFETNRLVTAEVSVTRLGSGPSYVLEALVDGEMLDPGRHKLLPKPDPASFQDVKIAKTPDGWAASFLF